MATNGLMVTIIIHKLWWHYPVLLMMRACVVLGWEFKEEAIDRFVSASIRISVN